MKKAGLYPNEKDMAILYKRFDKDNDDVINFKDLLYSLTPFMGG
jgi:Ca2+-binding EF-hand superfamily protein